MKPPHSILIIATRQIGDVLLATPLLHSIRRAWPQARIDVLVNRDKGQMLEGNSDCNSVIEVSEHPALAEYRTLLPRLFRKYDLAINTLAGDRPHLYALWSAPTRIGTIADIHWKSSWKRWVSERWVPLDNRNRHTVLQNLTLAEKLGIQPSGAIIPPSDHNGEEKLDNTIPFDWRQIRYAVIHPSPMWHYKHWTQAGWETLISYLLQQVEHICLTGGDSEADYSLLSQLSKPHPGKVHNLAGKLSFAVTSRLLQSAQLYVGPDTAMTHLAAACNTPTVAIYGPSNPVKWGPWPTDQPTIKPWNRLGRPFQRQGNVVLIQGTQPEERESCVPCAEEGCDQHKQSHSDCLLQLTAEEVIEAVEVLLSNE